MAERRLNLEFPSEFGDVLGEFRRTGNIYFVSPGELGVPELSLESLVDEVSSMYNYVRGQGDTVRLAFVVLIGDMGDASFSLPSVAYDGKLKSYHVLSLLSYYVPQALSWYFSYVFPEDYGCAFCPRRDFCYDMSTFLYYHGLASGVQNAVRAVTDVEDPGKVLPAVLAYLRSHRGMLNEYIGLIEDMLRRAKHDG